MDMNKSKWLSKEIIQELYYEQGLSAQEIGTKFGHGYSQVYKFMRRYNLPCRKRNGTRQLQFLRSPLSFQKLTRLTPIQKLLYTAGLMLYWAEGRKAGKHTVDFTNSDPYMVRVFLKMLREIYNITGPRLKCMIYCYSNQDPSSLHNYWSNLLNIPLTQFTKPYIRHDYDPAKTGKMPHGLIHIRYSDLRLLAQIKRDIGIIYSKVCRDTEAVKRAWL